MSINERIAQVILHFEKNNKTAFAEKTGIPAPTLSSIIGTRQTAPGFETLLKIIQTYPTLSLDWLMKEEGEIEKGKPNNTQSLFEQVKQMVKQELDTFKKDIQNDKKKMKNTEGFDEDQPQ